MNTKTFIAGIFVLAAIFGFAGVSQAAVTASPMKISAVLKTPIQVGETQTIKWSSVNGPTNVKVNVIRKVGSNPNRYELVRTVAKSTKNDGSVTWVPAAKDTGINTSIEIGCALSAQACRASAPSAAVAVVNSNKFANTAAAYLSIEASKNK